VVAFLIGRVSDYKSVPPVIHSRRIGIIDAVYVVEQFRRQGIGTLLVDHALLAMKVLNAVAAETIYEAFDQNAADLWQRAGFEPWMVHAYRML
jgi:GNAT superfamily N-acetyltransferase